MSGLLQAFSLVFAVAILAALVIDELLTAAGRRIPGLQLGLAGGVLIFAAVIGARIVDLLG